LTMKTIKIILILAVVSMLSPSCRLFPRKTPVILIVLDTVRKDHLSVYGYPRKTTPFLEKLAKESVVFNNAYTPIPLTAPAHTSLFTSAYPSEHQVLENGWQLLNWRRPLLAEVLKKNGYQTGAVVGSAILHRGLKLNRGFDFYKDDEFTILTSTAKKNLEQDSAEDDETGARTKKAHKRQAQDVTKWCRKWLEGIRPKAPFFLFAHFWDAHRAYYLPDTFVRPFQVDPEFAAWLEANHYLLKDHYELINEYDNAIFYLDQNLESLFLYLDQKGILNRALIIITADHGEGLGQHNIYWHCLRIYQEQTRVPLLIRFPDQYRAGAKIDANVSLIDLAPTILDFLKLKDPMQGRGESLLPLISGEKKERRACEFIERKWYPKENLAKLEKWAPGKKAGIICGEWKAIWASEEPAELYHLNDDAFELTNLKDTEKKKYLELETILQEHLEKVNFFSVREQEMSKKMQERLQSLGYLK